MKLSQLTSVAWCANMKLDRREQAPFTINDIYVASDQGNLVGLLLKIDDGGIIDFWAQNMCCRSEIELAFANAVEALRGREIKKTGIGDNSLCMVIAIVLEAIQQNFLE